MALLTDTNSPRLELLAPAGGMDSLHAALDAGADAVYLGLTHLNARRRARNFTQDELAQAVALAHGRGVRIYLTLNIDLAQRDLGQAARMLQLAQQAGVDAVLVRDPAVIAMRDLFPKLEFHFSTQTCMANSADVSAAAQLGASRVVLAREMTLPEISAASAVPGVQTEVFVQGALCFCISGRCLLSSWIGGRSGNRGACTSPCRVPYNAAGEPAGTPLSMRDLATAGRLDELRQAGVRAIKIEGRLKTAEWVGTAVQLYRKAIDGQADADMLARIDDLGAYTGRSMTDGYLDGHRDELTGQWGRAASSAAPSEETPAGCENEADEPSETANTPPAASGTFDLSMDVTDKGVVCRCSSGDNAVEWSFPKTVVRRAAKARTIASVLEDFRGQVVRNARLGQASTNQPDFLLVPRAVNALSDRIDAAVRQLQKSPDDLIRIDIPDALRQAIAPGEPSSLNIRALGERPDRARLHAGDVAGFLRRIRQLGSGQLRPDAVIVENLSLQKLPAVLDGAVGSAVIPALPQVMFEHELPLWRQLLVAAVAAGLTVEINSWGGWTLAREVGLPFEVGPGMGVLNGVAARFLAGLGAQSVAISREADRQQLQDLAAHCAAPLSLEIFGRPPLMITRVAMPREQFAGQTIEDRRGNQLIATQHRGLWIFCPPDPYDLRPIHNERIKVAHLVMDLVASKDPAGEWLTTPAPGARPLRFNYGRTLA